MKKFKGFTLIELIVVVAIIGVLIAIIAPSTKGSADTSEAKKVQRLASAMFDNWETINTTCGTTKAIRSTNHPIVGGNTGASDENGYYATPLAISGIDAYPAKKATYGSCYAESGAKSLVDTGLVKGPYYGYYQTVTDTTYIYITSAPAGTKQRVIIEFSQIPAAVAKHVVAQYVANPDVATNIVGTNFSWYFTPGTTKGNLRLWKEM